MVQFHNNEPENIQATDMESNNTAGSAMEINNTEYTKVESYNIVSNNALNTRKVNNQVTFTITEDQYVAAMRLHSRRQLRVLPLILIMLALFLGVATLSLTTAFITVGFFAAYVAMIFYLVRSSIKKSYRSLPQLHGDQTIQFSEEGLVWHNHYALAKLKWPLYQKFAVDDNMYLLYQGPTIFNVVPRSAFHSQEQEDAFRMILELNVKPAIPPKRNTRKRVSY